MKRLAHNIQRFIGNSATRLGLASGWYFRTDNGKFRIRWDASKIYPNAPIDEFLRPRGETFEQYWERKLPK